MLIATVLPSLLLFPAPQDPPGPPTAQDEQAQLYEMLSRIDRTTPEVLVVRAASPAVVSIETEVTQQVNTFWGLRDQTYTGAGSGVVIHADGYIVTNDHVVKGAKSITVRFEGDRPGHVYPAELLAGSVQEDLALLRIRPDRSRPTFPTVRMGTSTDLERGERVVAIGNPHGQSHTVSTGIISGLARNVELPDQGLRFHNLIQTDASINLGNSGGPLLNMHGELIGINTVMNSMAENIGFAIPVDQVHQVLIETLMPLAQHRWLGFELSDSGPLTVDEVYPNSPADIAGICEGYEILSLAGTTVTDRESFQLAALEIPERGHVQLVARDGEAERQVMLDPWDRLDGLLFERLGMTVVEARDNSNQVWLRVDRLSPGGPADEIELKPGDYLVALGVETSRQPLRVRRRSSLAGLVQRLNQGAQLDLDVRRETSPGQHDRLTGSLTVR